MKEAELFFRAADHAAARLPSALWVAAPLSCDHDHSWLSVLEAELFFHAADNAEARRPSALSVAAPFSWLGKISRLIFVLLLVLHDLDLDHSWIGVFGAELFFHAADHAEERPHSAPWVAARHLFELHCRLGMLRAKLRLLTADHAEARVRGAPRVVALLARSSFAQGKCARTL